MRIGQCDLERAKSDAVPRCDMRVVIREQSYIGWTVVDPMWHRHFAPQSLIWTSEHNL